VQDGIVSVARELEDAARTRAVGGSVMHVEATALLSGGGDTAAQASARRVLDLMLDSTAALAGEDPPRLVRAALAGSLAQAWAASGEPRYREAGRVLVRDLAKALPNLAALDADDAVFVDQEAFVIEHLLLAAATFGEPAAEKRALAELDVLLQRTYARRWGVRHAIAQAPAAGMTIPLGMLQDHVQVASACLAAHHVSTASRYLDVALDLTAVIERSYADPLGGYYDVADAPSGSLPALGDRSKHVFDDVLPGPNAAMALFLAHLAQVTGDPSYRRRAQHTLEAFVGVVSGTGVRASTFLAAARETLGTP